MQRLHIGLAFALTLALALPAHSQTGNLAPNGPHFELGIIGVSDPKTQPLTDSNRHTIFVGLGRNDKVTTNIYLTQGPFTVCDGNGFDPATDCSGKTVDPVSGAVFQLPCDTVTDTACDATGKTQAAYAIWARALGRPGGQATISTCGTTDLGAVICSLLPENQALLVRGHGQQTFSDVTKQLTTIEGSITLFTSGYKNFFWQYDNNGLKLAQVRFYPVTP